MGCKAQLTWKCLFTPIFRRAILTRKVGQSDLVFGVWSGFIMICSTLVNIQTYVYTPTHAHTDSILASLYEKLSQVS